MKEDPQIGKKFQCAQMKIEIEKMQTGIVIV